jgi:hypothetical protein
MTLDFTAIDFENPRGSTEASDATSGAVPAAAGQAFFRLRSPAGG